jgi:hypothetical protein
MAQYSELKWQFSNIFLQGESLITDEITSWSLNTSSEITDYLIIYMAIYYIINRLC